MVLKNTLPHFTLLVIKVNGLFAAGAFYNQQSTSDVSWSLRARALFAGKELLSVLFIILLNSLLIINGASEDAYELRALMSEGALIEAPLEQMLSFLAFPVISCQLLIGLCWLVFHYFPAKRAGIIFRKTVLTLIPNRQSLLIRSALSCRAPPKI